MNPETNEKLWEISWESSNLALVNGKQSGAMFRVKGTAYEKGQVASTFSGDRAEADAAVDRLIIEGNVRVASLKSPKAVMTAKKVEWLADLKVYKASGSVEIEGERAVVGPTNELYVSPELDKIGTSKDYFKK